MPSKPIKDKYLKSSRNVETWAEQRDVERMSRVTQWGDSKSRENMGALEFPEGLRAVQR
jgi:hypothetical protein